MFKEFRLLFPFFSPFSFMTSISFSFYFIVFYCFLFFCSFQFYHGLILDFLSHLRLNPTLQRVPSINQLKWNQIDGTVCIKEIGDKEPYYNAKILIFSFIWAGLAALHKASTL